MDPELKSLLEETLRVTEDNNRILRAMRRDSWIGLIGRIVFWILIAIVPFYFLSAYLAPFMDLMKDPSGAGDSSYMEGLQKVLEQYKVQ
ncbi:MAG: hypothetical protein WAV21_00985 [Minisyncoccia bacterium]